MPTRLDPQPPFRSPDGVRTPSQSRGEYIFNVPAKCASCHKGEQTTDNLWHGVGSFAQSTDGSFRDEFTIPDSNDPTQGPGVNTPSLSDLWFTGPYYHDGRYDTVEERLNRSNPENSIYAGSGTAKYGQHGDFSQLSDADLADLAAYLRTL